MEQGQHPDWGKNGISDEEYLAASEILEGSGKKYLEMKDLYFEKLAMLEKIKREMSEVESRGKLGVQDRKTLTNTINSIKEELQELKAKIDPLAKELSPLITDPRYMESRFENLHRDREDIDYPLENIGK